MKRLSACTFLLGASLVVGAQSITSSGFTWSPSLLTVTAGTPITITVTGNHDMREVSMATWNANGTTGNGGFEYLAGTHILTLTTPGTYYYVCVVHIGMGMKGRIVVDPATGVAEEDPTTVFSIFPNPAADEIVVTFPAGQGTQFSLVDVKGVEVLLRPLTGTGRIDVRNVPVGSYFAFLLDAQGTITDRQRIVIAR